MIEKIRNCSKPAFAECTASKPLEVVEKGLDELESTMRCGFPEENGKASPSADHLNKNSINN